MHPIFSKKPSVSTVLQQQRKYSAQQMSKIQQSNNKLDQLQEKMKSLLERDKNKSKSNNNFVPRQFNNNDPDSDQVNRYFESSRKHKMSQQEGNDIDNDDLLLENNEYKHDKERKQNTRNFSIYEANYKNKQVASDNHTKRQKSTTSLKIFKKPSISKAEKGNHFSINNQKNLKNSNKNGKTVSFGNYDSRRVETNGSKQLESSSEPNIGQQQSKQNNIEYMMATNLASMIHPNSDVYQINQLELMMQKSLQIKEKQLVLAQQQLKKIEQSKVHQYRRNMELEIQLQNMKKFRNQVKVMGKITKQNMQLQSNANPEFFVMFEEVFKQKDDLQTINKTLLKQLKDFQDEQYKLKLQKKRMKFEFGSLQREFDKLLKHRNKRMKQNIASNQQRQPINEESTQRILTKRQPSSKIFKTHKKHSSSTIQPRQSTQYQYEKYLQPQYINTKRSSKPKAFLSKSKEKETTPIREDLTKQKISKSTSCSGINRNRHALSSCQAQYKNCETDKVLYEMVHELDKLKDIVNKEIVKTRSKKSQRRVIQLYSQGNRSGEKERVAFIR